MEPLAFQFLPVVPRLSLGSTEKSLACPCDIQPLDIYTSLLEEGMKKGRRSRVPEQSSGSYIGGLQDQKA